MIILQSVVINASRKKVWDIITEMKDLKCSAEKSNMPENIERGEPWEKKSG
jgi:hypothetical protein